MLYPTDLMIDLETLGTNVDCPVLSIGGAFFHINQKEIVDTFHYRLDTQAQIDDGRKPSISTIHWWIRQATEAKTALFGMPEWEVGAALEDLKKKYRDQSLEAEEQIRVWGNGSSFDISIMEHLYQMYDISVPWKYNSVCDLRTFKIFVAKNAKMTTMGTKHDALSDAVSQAFYVMDNYVETK